MLAGVVKNAYLCHTNHKTTHIMAEEKRTYHCGECGGEIQRRQVFCPTCGKKLDHYDFED